MGSLLKNRDKDAREFFLAGTRYLIGRDYSQAIGMFDRAIDIRPDYLMAYFGRGEARLGLGRYEESLVDFNECIRINPDFPCCYFCAGCAYFKMGLYDEARISLNRALSLDPSAGGGKARKLLRQIEDPFVVFKSDRAPSEAKVRKLLQAKKELIRGRESGGRLSALHWAVKNGFIDAVKVLIESGALVNCRDMPRRRWTPLFFAVFYDRLETALLLIENGASVNARDINGLTCLHVASQLDRVQFIRMLTEKGANLKAMDASGQTPLDKAISHKRDRGAKLLKELMEINGADGSDYAPLHEAAYIGHLELAYLLLKKGAYVNVKDRDGQTPLHYAVFRGDGAMTRLLIEKGADLNARDSAGRKPHDLSEPGVKLVNNPFGHYRFGEENVYPSKETVYSGIADDMVLI